MSLPKLVITDIDGVWTDGGIYYSNQGEELKKFSFKDGWGVRFLKQLAIPLAIMTGENSQIVQRRADKLQVDYCFLAVSDKVSQAKALCNELNIHLSEVAFIGDDLNDLSLLKQVGFSGCPQNAPEYIKNQVSYVTHAYGGDGAFREFVEKILTDHNCLNQLINNY